MNAAADSIALGRLGNRDDTSRIAPSSYRAAPRWLFWALVGFFVLEYARPAGLVQLKLQAAATMIIPILWLSARDRPRSSILTAQVVFMIVCGVGVLFASNYFAAYLATRTMIGNVGMALGISWILSDRETFRSGAFAWISVMGYVGLFAVTHGGRGVGGFLGDENDVALACCAAMPFAWYGFERMTGVRRLIVGGCGLLTVGAVVASYSRGGFVGLVAAGGYCFLASRRKLLAVGIGAVSVAGFLLFSSPAYLRELTTISDTDSGTAETRKFLWQTAWNVYVDNPVLGVGAQNFNFVAGDYQPRDGKWSGPEYSERSWSGTTVHSLYYQALSETGSVGAALLSLVAFVHFRTLSRLRRDVVAHENVPRDLRNDTEHFAGALAGAMIGYLVAGAFISVLFYPYLWYLSGFAVALDTAVRRELAALPAVTSADAHP